MHALNSLVLTLFWICAYSVLENIKICFLDLKIKWNFSRFFNLWKIMKFSEALQIHYINITTKCWNQLDHLIAFKNAQKFDSSHGKRKCQFLVFLPQNCIYSFEGVIACWNIYYFFMLLRNMQKETSQQLDLIWRSMCSW